MYPNRPGSAPPRPKPRKPGIVFQPRVYHDLKQGIDLIANLLRPTLGPLPRLVAIARIMGDQSPEFLDDGGTIARRIIQVKGRNVDMGAMLLRNLAWKMNKTVGDGSVTMAVIFQSLINEGIRTIVTQGGNPMLLRQGLERSLERVSTTLRQMAEPLNGSEELAGIARGLCQGDDEMATMLGEIMDIVGHEGFVEVRSGSRIKLEREYVEGTFWDSSGWFSSIFETDSENHRALMEDPSILISDLSVKSAADFVPVLEMAVKAKISNLVFIGFEIPDEAMALFARNSQSKTISVLPVHTPRITQLERTALLQDIAVLTGGRVFHDAARETLKDVRLEDLGVARIAWANSTYFGVIGGKGDSRLVRQYINQLRESLGKVDQEGRDQIQKRIGRLIGGSAILKVSGRTESEMESRKAVAQRGILALRNAVESGVVLGGGTAFLNCQAALATAVDGESEEDIEVRGILSRALEEPLRTIAANAGFVPDTIVDKVKAAPVGFGFDARSGKIVDLRDAGIIDSVKVLDMALRVAVSGAAAALTTDVLIHRKYPPEIMEP
jgi:chaperonin GroEL